MKRILLALFLLATACGSDDETAAQTDEKSNNTPVSQDTVPAAKPDAKPNDAASIVAALKAKGLPIAAVKVYTENDDPNSLLGRPGQYTSKANFHDRRLDPPVELGQCEPIPPGAPPDAEPVCHDKPKDPGVEHGGSVETFASSDDAKRRADYVKRISQSFGPLVEYDFLQGKVLLRLSKDLTPTQAKQYEQTLAGI